MATDKQIAANRRNAQRSTGPTTPEGKAAVGRNRLSHGLAGEHVVLPDEDSADYDRLLAALIGEHQPSSPTEEFLVRQIAQAQWKLDRIARMDASLLAGQMAECPEPDPASAFRRDCSGIGAIMLLCRYEGSARRGYYRALHALRALGEDRRRAASDPAAVPAAAPAGSQPPAPPAETVNNDSNPIPPPPAAPPPQPSGAPEPLWTTPVEPAAAKEPLVQTFHILKALQQSRRRSLDR